MVFNSTIFLFYFLPLVLLLHTLIPARFKNYFLLLASLVFFAWGAPVFLYILIISLIPDFILGNLIYRAKNKKFKKVYLALSVLLNLGLLVYFKYSGFLADTINPMLSVIGCNSMHWKKIALPLGISFLTFQKISYAIDIYRASKPPQKSILNYTLYILLFPKLISGPIILYKNFADQIAIPKGEFSITNKVAGLQRFIIGLSKKMLIANPLGRQVDLFLSGNISDLGMASSWIIILAYSMQIYFDFSGYSDMAIGIGRMLGFHFTENFRFPYISRNFIEFWRRWHISLTSWFRDYLFLPLAYKTSRILPKYSYMGIKSDHLIYASSLLVTFLLTGLWHGASWNFVLWGIFHGILLVLNRFAFKKVFRIIGSLASTTITFLLISLGWVMFRLESFSDMALFYHNLFAFNNTVVSFPVSFYFALILSVLIAFLPAFGKMEHLLLSFNEPALLKKNLLPQSLLFILLLILCMSQIVSTGFSPFIYFRF